MESWIRVCDLEEIPVLGARVLKGREIALFRDGSGSVFALRDKCPHKGGPLSQGIVSTGRVTCPLHGLNIGLCDGRADPSDEGCVETYSVKVESGQVFLWI